MATNFGTKLTTARPRWMLIAPCLHLPFLYAAARLYRVAMWQIPRSTKRICSFQNDFTPRPLPTWDATVRLSVLICASAQTYFEFQLKVYCYSATTQEICVIFVKFLSSGELDLWHLEVKINTLVTLTETNVYVNFVFYIFVVRLGVCTWSAVWFIRTAA